MESRLLPRVAWLRSQASNLVVFAVLGLILYLGHHYDWKFPSSASSNRSATQEDAEDVPTPKMAHSKASPAPTVKPAGGTRIRLASAETIAKTDIKTQEVTAVTFPEHVLASGSIEYDKTRMAQLSTRAPGVVFQVLSKVGDSVKEGDTLAIVESVEVGKAKSEFLQAVVQFELKEKMLNVSRNLESTIAKKEIVELESRLREARIQKVNAQQTLINFGLPIDLKDCLGLTDDQIIHKLHTLGLPEDWAPKFDPARTTANLVPLKAPFSGRVIGSDLVKGESVSPGQAKIVIANTDAMWVVLDVGIEDAYRLRLGQDLTFRPDGYKGDEIVSTLTWISTEADPKTRRVQARAEVKNPSGLLRANTFGAGKIKVREEPNAVAVNNGGLHWDMEAKTHLVFVCIDKQTFEARPVRLGARSESMTEVVGNLNAGERIAVEGSYILKSELLRMRMASADSR